MAASLDDVLPLADRDLAGHHLAGHHLADIDHRISSAFSDLGLARGRFADSPSGESITACVAAEAAVNDLLDLRFGLTSAHDRLS